MNVSLSLSLALALVLSQERLLEGERLVDFVAGPDAYRDLPRLVRAGNDAGHGPPINVQLSAEET